MLKLVKSPVFGVRCIYYLKRQITSLLLLAKNAADTNMVEQICNTVIHGGSILNQNYQLPVPYYVRTMWLNKRITTSVSIT
tara:strand:+ start:1986 stop:2228 length:243 start_codon:yes stop_codon:yes gene_type:complete